MLELLRHEPLSASELARRLQIRFGSARFHLQALVRGGLAAPAGARTKRGGREQLFAAPEEVWVDVDAREPRTVLAMHRAYLAEVRRRLEAAALDQRPEDTLLDVVSLRTVELTPAERARAEQIVARAVREIRALDQRGEPEAEPVTLAAFLFRTPRDTPP
jgi:hypothetical protein